MPEQDVVECELFLIVNASGEYIAHEEENDLMERWVDEANGFQCAEPQRVVRIVVKVPRPKPVNAVVTVAPEPDTATAEAA